jgi:glyoxylase-like metal-dependent hydrolase (beta-lactamase superfamily II)
MKEVASGVYRLGSYVVNWYLVEDGGKFTVVDAGLPKRYDQLPAALATLGATIGDVEAVVLTHAHADHLGSSARIKDESGAGVYVHDDDADLARGEVTRKNEYGYGTDLLRPYSWKSMVHLFRGGALGAPPVLELKTFAHGERLDLPGRPLVIFAPGHTEGSSCIELTSRKVLCSGDVLSTLNVMTGARGPRLMPRSFNENNARAMESLVELVDSEADLILPGHGEPWSGAVSDAVAEAQRVGVS